MLITPTSCGPGLFVREWISDPDVASDRPKRHGPSNDGPFSFSELENLG